MAVQLLLDPVHECYELSMEICESAAIASSWCIRTLLCNRLRVTIGHPKILYRLAQSGHYQLVKWSITMGAQNISTNQHILMVAAVVLRLRLPLHLVAIQILSVFYTRKAQRHDVVKVLLEYRASHHFEHIRAKALALQSAARCGFWSVARSLLEHGVPPDEEKGGYRSPMEEALNCGHQHIVHLLRSYRAQELDFARVDS